MTTRTTLAVCACLGLATIAVAMNGADTDGDGQLTMDEVKAAAPEVSEDAFNLADQDQDGVLGEGEIADAIQAGILPQLGG